MKPLALIIEDNEQNSYLLRFLLEKHGWQVVLARDGRIGIDEAVRLIPTLILLDIQLPHMDGYQVLQELRQHHILAEVPIVAVTSYAMAGDRERILAAGCTGYMEKPIQPESFLNELEKYVTDTRRSDDATP